ncbi:MAG: hypothetical protein ACYDAL_09950 [Candidatus Dormibacteraceae bacterium]
MQERSEEQIISRLFELENSGQAERRTLLSEERYLSLIHDPDRTRAYVFQHGTDDTEGAEVPPGTEFWEYPTLDEASRAYDQLLAESGSAGEVVEVDSEEGIGDSETDGAEVRDRYSASDEDLLIDNEEAEDSDDAVS